MNEDVQHRRKIQINGIVQGVGFRPHVYRLAVAEHLSGFVANTSRGVVIEAEGRRADLDRFITQIREAPPVRARITEFHFSKIPATGRDKSFEILKSPDSMHRFTLISPDIATCEACLKELFDPANRRYRYPFINCTDCGPRYTIIRDVPYDRPKTTMKSFRMCPECQDEYDDPANRRFHAQPNACPVCGPRVWLTDGSGSEIRNTDPMKEAIQLLKQGKILAVKGLGGFHLACDATHSGAVRRLRERKHREEKPLAVMVRNADAARNIAQVNAIEEELLCSAERPIVLMKKIKSSPLCEAVAPDNTRVGVMLPYTPLHHLLLDAPFSALVMTSGNLSEEPIAFTNTDALERLGKIADYFLLHDRDIHIRNDDSVVTIMAEKSRFIRRSRGFAPMPVFVPEMQIPVLAVGGELKNTIAVLKGKQAFLSHHIGDLENAETLKSFEQATGHMQKLLDIEPQIIAHDLHPDYLSTQWAVEQPLKTVAVQHHHAHIVSCMAENQHQEPVIGIALDGTGLGTDGKIWGGEILVSDMKTFQRAAHLAYYPMPGGEKAIHEPWRMAMAYLTGHSACGSTESPMDMLKEISVFQKIPADSLRLVGQMIQNRINAPMTSSLGRLFDAVSFLCGLCTDAAYEGQPAMILEQVMGESAFKPVIYEQGFQFDERDMPVKIDLNTLIQSIVRDIQNHVPVNQISRKFHASLVDLFLRLSQIVSKNTGLYTIVLSGGCFQNRYLMTRLAAALEHEGFKVLTHRYVPCNDGGLALGQAVIAACSG